MCAIFAAGKTLIRVVLSAAALQFDAPIRAIVRIWFVFFNCVLHQFSSLNPIVKRNLVRVFFWRQGTESTETYVVGHWSVSPGRRVFVNCDSCYYTPGWFRNARFHRGSMGGTEKRDAFNCADRYWPSSLEMGTELIFQVCELCYFLSICNGCINVIYCFHFDVTFPCYVYEQLVLAV